MRGVLEFASERMLNFATFEDVREILVIDFS